MYICIYAYICIYTYICIYVYLHIHIHLWLSRAELLFNFNSFSDCHGESYQAPNVAWDDEQYE